ncbi:MAG TPA: exodeoxyribonuclease VII large subunit [Gaiellales bacterium]|nr:exodeoxyribonuclease VII large subunit [Gaiellales bacterium]
MPSASSSESPRRVYSVANVNRGLARRIDELPALWVEGEIGDLRYNPKFGFTFLTLRDPDEGATLSVTMSRWAFERIDPRPVEGQRVQVHGKVTVYDKRAELSLRADRIEPAGDGALLARIEEARRRLDADGLFDAMRKRQPPLWPRGIGLIAGHEAAAPLDVIRNSRARLPSARFVLAETAVQGERAVPEILRALLALDARADVDVIVIARGGGSLEDLLPFSDEGLCRAIAACSTVVVSAVGHERDVPLCDLVADRRASTPTDAARLIVPDARQELENVERLRSSARRCAERVVVRARERLEALASRPALRSADYWVVSRREALGRLRAVLDGAPQRALAVRAERAEQLVARLRAVAPQATLERGYAIVIDERGLAVRDAAAIAAGERVDLRLARGGAGARIEEVRADG